MKHPPEHINVTTTQRSPTAIALLILMATSCKQKEVGENPGAIATLTSNIQTQNSASPWDQTTFSGIRLDIDFDTFKSTYVQYEPKCEDGTLNPDFFEFKPREERAESRLPVKICKFQKNKDENSDSSIATFFGDGGKAALVSLQIRIPDLEAHSSQKENEPSAVSNKFSAESNAKIATATSISIVMALRTGAEPSITPTVTYGGAHGCSLEWPYAAGTVRLQVGNSSCSSASLLDSQSTYLSSLVYVDKTVIAKMNETYRSQIRDNAVSQSKKLDL